MATKSTKSTIVKAKTTAPKISRARKSDTITGTSDRLALIAARAYERFATRGYEHGHDVEDWLGAERELAETT
jgi:Protein of unknown function (DUF2934)